MDRKENPDEAQTGFQHRDAFGAPASRRVAQPRRGQSADSCLSAWPRSGSREFESDARRGEQRRGVALQGDRLTGVPFFLVTFFLGKQEKVTGVPATSALNQTARSATPYIPGNIPFIFRIIFAMPPLAMVFIIFCICSN